ncbi:MAG TPA: hypothetical protein VFI70_12140 [Nitrososphaeraceae archaeon]|nr:hypothetical protein [Nitrososphaeraceae archaeon]
MQNKISKLLDIALAIFFFTDLLKVTTDTTAIIDTPVESVKTV